MRYPFPSSLPLAEVRILKRILRIQWLLKSVGKYWGLVLRHVSPHVLQPQLFGSCKIAFFKKKGKRRDSSLLFKVKSTGTWRYLLLNRQNWNRRGFFSAEGMIILFVEWVGGITY